LDGIAFTNADITWFLDQDIPSHPKEGYIRILDESLLWEERLGKPRITTAEGPTTCMEPHRGWTIARSSWNFYTARLDRAQELITVIHEEAKRTEEKEEAGYRSPA